MHEKLIAILHITNYLHCVRSRFNVLANYAAECSPMSCSGGGVGED